MSKLFKLGNTLDNTSENWYVVHMSQIGSITNWKLMGPYSLKESKVKLAEYCKLKQLRVTEKEIPYCNLVTDKVYCVKGDDVEIRKSERETQSIAS